jgi:hypothetical protein
VLVVVDDAAEVRGHEQVDDDVEPPGVTHR